MKTPTSPPILREKNSRAPRSQKDGGPDSQPGGQVPALDENVEAIKAWERSLAEARTRAERLADWIAATFASGPVLLAHVVWFALWVVVNTGLIPAVRPFDAFPFPFLTMTVSLEAIFLALFVLASQNRLARQSDKRAHLDLQIDLLAEREMTAVLQLLQDIATHMKVERTLPSDQIRDLLKKTDVQDLTQRLDEFSDSSASSKPES